MRVDFQLARLPLAGEYLAAIGRNAASTVAVVDCSPDVAPAPPAINP